MDNNGSTVSRILGIVVGVITIIMGIVSLFMPIRTYGVIGWLIAFALIADGVSKIMLWKDLKGVGVTDTWALVGGIISTVLGVILLFSHIAQMAVDVMVAYFVSGWLFLGGIVRIARSFKMRDVHKTLGTTFGANWDLALIMGILMVMLGIFCMANPVIVMVSLGLQIGVAMILGGLGLISATM